MRIHLNISQMQIVISDLFHELITLRYWHSGTSAAHKDSKLSGFWLSCFSIRPFQRVEINHSPGEKVQVGGVALAHGGERVGSFVAYKSLGGPLISSHYIGLLADYHFNYSMCHVRGNFDLKTMAARVGSGPSVKASHLRQGVARSNARWLALLIEIFLLSYCITY